MIKEGHLTIVKSLLGYGQTTEPTMTEQGVILQCQNVLGLKDNEQNTALHLASGVDKESSPPVDSQCLGAVIRLLLDAGAELQEKNNDGKTAADLIMASGRPECFQSLLYHT